MINEEKVALMTRAAIAEKKDATAIRSAKYYRKDYVNYHVILVGICVSIAVFMIYAIAAVMFVESSPQKAQKLDWIETGFSALLIYLIVLVLYIIITMTVYTIRYNRYAARIKDYSTTLKKIGAIYEVEEENAKTRLSEAIEWDGYEKKRKLARKRVK